MRNSTPSTCIYVGVTRGCNRQFKSADGLTLGPAERCPVCQDRDSGCQAGPCKGFTMLLNVLAIHRA